MYSHLPTSLFLLLHIVFISAADAVTSTIIASTITVTESSSASATAAASTSFTNASTFQDDVVRAHNFYRGQHNASAVVWNETLATAAGKWAAGCVFEHSGEAYGENLVAGSANATAGVDAWALEREDYNWKKPGFSEKTGHFTQLVWSNTTSVGCGVKSCQGSNNTPGFFVVCEYWPRGNIVGDENRYFVDNVRKQVRGQETDTVESGTTSDGAVGGGSALEAVMVQMLVLAGMGVVL